MWRKHHDFWQKGYLRYASVESINQSCAILLFLLLLRPLILFYKSVESWIGGGLVTSWRAMIACSCHRMSMFFVKELQISRTWKWKQSKDRWSIYELNVYKKSNRYFYYQVTLRLQCEMFRVWAPSETKILHFIWDAQITWSWWLSPPSNVMKKPRSSVCTHSEHQACTKNILQSLCISNKIVETYRNQHLRRFEIEKCNT
jgi:hypothetical protein